MCVFSHIPFTFLILISMRKKQWNQPRLQVLDTVVSLTGASYDKIGSSIDAVSYAIEGLDGTIQPD